MKKRVLALLLCAVIVLPFILTSCGGTEDPTDTTEKEEAAYLPPVSLNFYIITDDRTSETAKGLMQEAFNLACKENDYKTEVHFVFCTADEYEQIVYEKLEACENSPLPSPADKYQYTVEHPELTSTVNELGLPVDIFPDVYDNQMDILLITSKEMHDKLVEDGQILDLTAALADQNKAINSHINSNLLNGSRVDGSLYGVPNNVLIGNYKYIIINKKLVDMVYMDQSNFQRFENEHYVFDYNAAYTFAKNLLSDKEAILHNINESITDPNEKYTNLYPMTDSFKDFEYPTVALYDYNGIKTFFGTTYTYYNTFGSSVRLTNVLSLDAGNDYRNFLSLKIAAKSEGFYASSGTIGQNVLYGIDVIEASYAEAELYKNDYYLYQVDSPRLGDDDAFKAMFAVSKHTVSLERSMTIIEDLLCNEDAMLRNILQYGAPNQHFLLNEGEVLTVNRTRNCDYFMNYNYTGNVATLYPCLDDGMTTSFKEYFRRQNENATRNPIYGLTSEYLWENTRTGMISLALSKKMATAITRDINALTVNDCPNMLATVEGTASPSEKLKQLQSSLIAGIPKSADESFYKEYWISILCDVHPTIPMNAEKFEQLKATEEYQNRKKEVTSLVNTSAVSLRFEANDLCDLFIAEAVEISSYYMNLAENAETREEFEAICNELNTVCTSRTNDKYQFLNGTNEETPYGMLVERISGEPCTSTLAGVFYLWWYNK